MRVSELKHTMEFVITNVKDREIIPSLNELTGIIRQNAQPARPNNPQQQRPITNEKQKVLSKIGEISLDCLTFSEQNILASFFDLKKLGAAGAAFINQVFANHNLDPIGAATALDNLRDQFAVLEKNAIKTLEVLDPLKVEVL